MTVLKTGDAAPDFSAPDQTGATRSLTDYRGKKVALYFYPKDDTPGCTKEACNLRDNHNALQTAGYEVLGVSTDGVDSHKQFAEKHSLPFPLIADPDMKIVNDYGVWGEKNLYGKKYMGTSRWTFIIDEHGTIRHIFKKVDTENHAAQILAKQPKA